MQRILPK